MSLGEMGCMSVGPQATISKQFPNKDVFQFSVSFGILGFIVEL